MTISSQAIYWHILVRGWRLFSWRRSWWVCRISIAFSLVLKVLVLSMIDLCRLTSVISYGWATWVADTPWSLSFPSWPIDRVASSTCSCCLYCYYRSCQGLIVLLTIVSMKHIIWWAIMLVGDQSIPFLKQIFMMKNGQTRTGFAAFRCSIHSWVCTMHCITKEYKWRWYRIGTFLGSYLTTLHLLNIILLLWRTHYDK